MIDTKTVNLVSQIVRKHLPDHSYKSFIFGSHATGKNRKFSDIDLGIMGPRSLSSKEYISIVNDLEESNLSYRVDLVDFTKVSDKFKQVSLRDTIQIWTKKLNSKN